MPKKYHILVADDETSVLFILEHILLGAGYEVETAINGVDAIEKINKTEFDLVLLDIRMEPGSGIETLEALHSKYPDTVVIILTGYGTLESAVEALRLGAFDYLFKPATPEVIRKRVQDGIQQREKLIQRSKLQDQIDALRNALVEMDSPKDSSLPPPAELRFRQAGNLDIDYYHRSAMLSGRLLNLTTTEFDLLQALVSAAPEPVSSQELARLVMGYNLEEREARDLIKWHIHQLRCKVETDRKNPLYIKNIRYKGYLWSGNQ
jgi:DNA-binding response OmpR family regulator